MRHVVRGVTMAAADYFAFFGLDESLNADLDDLQARFYRLSREWHPDRFSRRPAEEQQKALDATALLNDGYRVLRDPVKRAEYVLSRHGFDTGGPNTKDVPPELLEEMFELNMAMEEGDAAAVRTRVSALLAEADAQLAALATRFDAGKSSAVLKEVRGVLNRRRYLENLSRQQVPAA